MRWLHNLYRLLSFIFHLFLQYSGAQWLLAVGLLWYGWYVGHDDLVKAYPWWALGALGVVGHWIADACGFALFLPDRDPYGGVRKLEAPEVTQGVAAGYFDLWNEARMRFPSVVVDAQVQVRWMGRQRLPELLLLMPHELPPTLFSPLESAEASSVWYEGSEVTRGLVYIAGAAYPGIRLRFLGRQTLLGLSSEEEAAALEQTLSPEAPGR